MVNLNLEDKAKVQNPELKDRENPEYYQNRELSWLDFNERVIAEAEDKTNPLVEQLTFLAIGSTNLDEFVRVRVAGLKEQVKFGIQDVDNKKKWSADKQLEEISKKNIQNVAYQYELYQQKIVEVEETYGFLHRRVDELTEDQKSIIKGVFEERIKPAITPFGVDAYRPFPNLDNDTIHIFVHLEREGESYVAIVPIPQQIERYHIINTEDNKAIVIFTEDIVRDSLDVLFKGFAVKYTFNFRVSRSADLELHEEGAEDLLSVIENYLERRKNGEAVRLEIDIRTANDEVVNDVVFLMDNLDLEETDVYAVDGPLDLDYLWVLNADIKKAHPGVGYDSFEPYYPQILKERSLFDAIDDADVLLHHPFDSFQPVIDLVAKAIEDPNTIAIKQTLYRVSAKSPLITNLKLAAQRGIQVTVLVELKARFDEENNVHWAKELEDAGVHILYGMKELKTHSKATLIVKKDHNKFKRYVHLGTGNYNEKTARLYTDMGLMTSYTPIVEDVASFFNYLSGYSEIPNYNHLHVSPNELRENFMDHIDEEIEYHKQHGNGYIFAKMNSLTDKQYILKLYEASQAGVKIELVIRGICCLIPGISGLSETITVRSIIGRFLEHTRIYYFYNNGDEKLYLASADMMTRNLSRRVEIAFPILDEKYRTEIKYIFELYLDDNYKSWELKNNAEYIKNQPNSDEEAISAQQVLMKKRENKKEIQTPIVQKNWFTRLREKLLQNRL